MCLVQALVRLVKLGQEEGRLYLRKTTIGVT